MLIGMTTPRRLRRTFCHTPERLWEPPAPAFGRGSRDDDPQIVLTGHRLAAISGAHARPTSGRLPIGLGGK
jgi:hypothetical protein